MGTLTYPPEVLGALAVLGIALLFGILMSIFRIRKVMLRERDLRERLARRLETTTSTSPWPGRGPHPR